MLNPPSTTYFLPTPPREGADEALGSDSSDLSSDEDEMDEQDAGSIRTDDLTPSNLHASELKALRRRMKKSFQWFPTPSCIKKELQTNRRWPPSRADSKAPRQKRKAEKLKRRKERQAKKLKRDRGLTTRKTAQARIDRAKNAEKETPVQSRKGRKKAEGEIQYAMPVAADEPTYCYCGDVSYGEMIACENEVCPLCLT